ncbi:right-handed parallel beta-helix repeat-containing protein [Rubritalea profundi]|uniref:right-handed parallel beta-helix repeat-containing protein n=1 Tax=Rubritalea profundi TaxID=1658618 RepID=UPI000CF565D2
MSDAGKYPLILHRGGRLDLSHVEISGSANHGMAVSGGLAKIEHCRFSGNHWDGLAVFGPTSSVHVNDSIFQGNADHGVDVWGGATALLESSVIERNSKSGVVVSGMKSLVTLVDVHSRANRECGIYLSLGASLTAERVEVSKNRFSGLIAQRINLLKWSKSDASSNGEFGYLMDRNSMQVLEGEFVGKENKLGLRSQKRLK